MIKNLSDKTVKTQAVLGLVWLSVGRYTSQFIASVTTIFVIRLLRPDDYGLFGYAMIFMGLCNLISEFSFGPAIVQKEECTSEDQQSAFWAALAVNVVLTGLLWLVSPLAADFFKTSELVSILRAISLILILSALRIVPWSLLHRSLSFKKLAVADAGSRLFPAFTALLCAYLGMGAWTLVIASLTRELVMTAAAYYFYPWRPQFKFSNRSFRQLLRFSISLTAYKSLWQICYSATSLIIGKVLGQTVLGHYFVIERLSSLVPDRLTEVANQVAFPIYSYFQRRPSRAKQFFLRNIELVSIILFPIQLTLFLLAREWIPLVLTSSWVGIIIPFQIICLWTIFASMIHLLYPLLTGKGRPDLNAKFMAVFSMVMPPVALYATRYGLEGVCLAWVMVHVPLGVGFFTLVHRLTGCSWQELLKRLKPAAVSTIGMLIVALITEAIFSDLESKIIKVLLVGNAGILGYLTVLIFGFREKVKEFKEILVSSLGEEASRKIRIISDAKKSFQSTRQSVCLKTSPKVTVIIPTYNYGRFITQTIESVFRQSFQPLEVIVVDDGSTDDTRERLRPYSRQIRYLYQEHLGVSAARNTGIRASKGDFIAFLDSDDIWAPRKLEFQLGFCEQFPETGLVGTESFSIDVRGRRRKNSGIVRREGDNFSKLNSLDLLEFGGFPTSSVLMKRACFDVVGLFDETLRAVEDMHCWVRIASKFPVFKLTEALTGQRIHGASVSRKSQIMLESNKSVLRKLFSEIPELKAHPNWLRIARARMYVSVAWMHYADRDRRGAMRNLLTSIWYWPLSLRDKNGNRNPLDRTKRLIRYCLGEYKI